MLHLESGLQFTREENSKGEWTVPWCSLQSKGHTVRIKTKPYLLDVDFVVGVGHQIIGKKDRKLFLVAFQR